MHGCLLSSADYSAAWIAVTWEWCCSWHRRWRGGRLFEPNCLEVGLSDAAYRVGISESCPVPTVPTPPPGSEPEAFSSLALFLPAAMAALCVAKPFPVSATTLFESRISKNHAIGFSPAFIFRLKGSAQPLDFRPVALTGIWSAGHGPVRGA